MQGYLITIFEMQIYVSFTYSDCLKKVLSELQQKEDTAEEHPLHPQHPNE